MALRPLVTLIFLAWTCTLAQSYGAAATAHNVAIFRSKAASQWPYTPWRTDGSHVKNARGEAVTIVGVNWPGSGETMLPEGLQYASATSIVARLGAAGFNFVRHTYAIQMIDEIFENGGTDVTIEVALQRGLGTQNGTRVLQQILKANEDLNWTAQTTRMEVWDALARIEVEHGIMMHPDNHVSRAKWCCSHTDGNAFFGDEYFDTEKWKRGLGYMATWAKSHRNIASQSLRNELRAAWPKNATDSTHVEYNWVSWAGNVTAGADAIHKANEDLLITIPGLQFDQDLSAVTQELNLNTAPSYKIDAIRDGKRRKPVYFKLDEHAWRDKAVLELHLYSMSENADTGDCEAIRAQLYTFGFNALGIDAPKACAVSHHQQQGRADYDDEEKEEESAESQYQCDAARRKTPVWLTEFGQVQDATLYNDTLTNCLRDFTVENKVGWAAWSIAGSYYAREGAQDVDDTWALLNHDWSDWRDPRTFQDFWAPYIRQMGRTNIEKGR